MSWMLVLPVLLPLMTAAATLLVGRSLRMQRILSVAGATATLGVTIALLVGVWRDGIQVIQMGDWVAPFGISFVADVFGGVMVVISATMGLAVLVYALGSLDAARERAHFHALYHALLMGVNGSFLTGDIFNLYVWFEVMVLASFALLVLGRSREQMRGGVQYVVINLFSSLSFLAAVGLLYGTVGTLNMADLAVKLPTLDPGLITTLSMLFLIAFGVKASLFPLFYWLPPSYPTAPIPIAALFAGLLTKVGVYALIRVFTLLFTFDIGYTHTILLWVAGLTMITGVLGAAASSDVRTILSFHIISQIGYMIMGLALFTPLAMLGAIFYIVHHIIVKTNLFLVGGITDRITGGFELERLGGLYRSHPWIAIMFIIPAFSLAGFPPLSGFWAKVILIKAGLDVGSYGIVAVALVVGLLTLFSMTKIWAGAFWKPVPEDQTPGRVGPAVHAPMALLVVPVAALCVLTLVIGLWAEPLFELAEMAAVSLLDTSTYIEAVLGTGVAESMP